MSKIIIWDLGNTLVEPDTYGIIREIGLSHFLLYSILDFKNPIKIKEIIFNLLKSSEPRNDSRTIYTSDGQILPALMCNWLDGSMSSTEIQLEVEECIKKSKESGYFVSSRQQLLINKTVDIMFNPKKLAEFMKPIKPAIELLELCTINKENRLFLLSNFDKESFNYLISSKQAKDIFKYFSPENIIISGNIKMLKPSPNIYQYLINKFNLDPKECIFIDDQAENVQAALDFGMTGLHLEKSNYKKLLTQLNQLHVF